MINKVLFVFALSLCPFQTSLAGEQERFDNLDGHIGFWVGLGVGGNYFGLTQSVNFSLAAEDHLFSIRYAKSREFQFSVEGYYNIPTIRMEEFALLYGRYFKKGNFALSFSGGISHLSGMNRGKNIQYKNYEPIPISALGLPLLLEFMVGVSENTGIALLCSGNLNQKKIFGGASAKINIGLF